MHEINRQSGRNWRDEFDMNANVLWTVGMSLMTVIFLMTSNNIIYMVNLPKIRHRNQLRMNGLK